MSNTSPEEIERDLAETASIAYALDEWYSRLGRQFGPLSRPQRRMLRLLSADTMVRVGDLGEQLGLTTAGTTRMLDKLEALGYSWRSRCSIPPISLTPIMRRSSRPGCARPLRGLPTVSAGSLPRYLSR